MLAGKGNMIRDFYLPKVQQWAGCTVEAWEEEGGMAWPPDDELGGERVLITV